MGLLTGKDFVVAYKSVFWGRDVRCVELQGRRKKEGACDHGFSRRSLRVTLLTSCDEEYK